MRETGVEDLLVKLSAISFSKLVEISQRILSSEL